VHVRPAGADGAGHLCRVRDANAEGVRLVVEDLAGLEDSPAVLEVLTASGRPQQAELELQVVWSERRDDGLQHIGCSFGKART
jgi:hypothetical protein